MNGSVDSCCVSKKGTMRTLGTPPPPSRSTQRSDDTKSGVNVKVIVRCRPLSELERKDPSQFQTVTTKCETKEVFVSQTIPGRKIDSYSKTFTFDGVCNQFTTQKELFLTYIVPIVDEVLQGFNCTIFAYGQTGTGKTYTMEGDIYQRAATNTMSSAPPIPSAGGVLRVFHEVSLTRLPNIPTSLTEEAGVIPRAVRYIFEALEAQDTEYSVRVSYLEIYNEELNDLLNDGDKQLLRIYEDTNGKKGFSVDRLEEIPVNNPQDILNILSLAVKKRRTAETLLNRQSSRSHCIFSITIHMKETNIEGEDVIKIGKLNLVDLAGSENIQRSGANTIKDRAKEAGMINQSLLTLGRVINALVEHSSYVPYRDSKLTRLLQESLGGRTKTCIVATISPSSLCLEETLSTLDYAFRAKNIRNRPEINQKMTKRVMIRELNHEIERLKVELQANREKNGVYLPIERYAELEARLSGQASELSEASSEMSRLRSDALQSNQEIVRLRDQLTAEINETSKCKNEIARLQDQLQIGTQAFRNWEQQIKQSCLKLLARINLIERESDILRSKLSSCRSGGAAQVTTLRAMDERRRQIISQLKEHARLWEDEWKAFVTREAQSLCTDLLKAGEMCEGDMKRLVDESIPPIGNNLALKLEAHSNQFNALIGKQTRDIEQLISSHSMEISSNQDNFVLLVDQQVKSLRSQTTDLTQHIHQLYKALNETDIKLNERFNVLCEKTTSDISLFGTSIKESLEVNCSHLMQLNSRIEEAKMVQTKWFRDACEDIQKEMEEKLKRMMSTNSENISSYMTGLSHACNHVMEDVTSLRKSVELTLDGIPNAIGQLQSISEERKANMASNLNELSPLCRSFDETTSPCLTTILETGETTKKQVTDLLTGLKGSVTTSSIQMIDQANQYSRIGKATGIQLCDSLKDVSDQLIIQSKNISSICLKQASSFKFGIDRMDGCIRQTTMMNGNEYDRLMGEQDKATDLVRCLESLLTPEADTPKHISMHVEVPLAGPRKQVWETTDQGQANAQLKASTNSGGNPPIGQPDHRNSPTPLLPEPTVSVKPLECSNIPNPLSNSESQPVTVVSAPSRPLLRSSSLSSRAGSNRRSASLTRRKKNTTEFVSSADLLSSRANDAVGLSIESRPGAGLVASGRNMVPPLIGKALSTGVIQHSRSGACSPISVSNGRCGLRDEEHGPKSPCQTESVADASWSPSESASFIEERPKRPAGSSRASSPAASSSKENMIPSDASQHEQQRQSFAKPVIRSTAQQQQQQMRKRITERGHQIKKRRASSQSRVPSP